MENSVVAEIDRPNEIKSKTQFNGTVIRTTLAGAVVDLGESGQGLLHVSQIQPSEEGQAIKSVADVLKIGQNIDVWVRRVKDGRIELTMFKPLDLEWREIKKGMTVKGKVVRLEGFGAFVEIGAERPGLVHISEMAHGYVRTPADVVQEGEEIETQVIDVNRKKKQIKLSIKALQPEPVIEVPERAAPEPGGPRKEKAAPRRTKKAPARRRSEEGAENLDELMQGINEPAEENEPTAMGLALLEAMEKVKERKQEDRKKKEKTSVSQEQEEILSRTLGTKANNNS